MEAVAKKAKAKNRWRRPASDAQIIATYRRTGTIRATRRVLGVSFYRIQGVLKAAGIRTQRWVLPTPEEIAERAAEVRRGWTGGAYDPSDDPPD